MFTIKGCSLIRGVHYERFHCISISMTKETEGGHVSPGSGRDWTEFWSNFTLTGKSSFNLQILSSHRPEAGLP